jgi:hypothetical protein
VAISKAMAPLTIHHDNAVNHWLSICCQDEPHREGFEGDKMEPSAHELRAAGLENGRPAIVLPICRENRLRGLRDLLTELQDEARVVFASSGETVDRFLGERRDEARRESGLPE